MTFGKRKEKRAYSNEKPTETRSKPKIRVGYGKDVDREVLASAEIRRPFDNDVNDLIFFFVFLVS